MFFERWSIFLSMFAWIFLSESGDFPVQRKWLQEHSQGESLCVMMCHDDGAVVVVNSRGS